jgi:hypothetical protein
LRILVDESLPRQFATELQGHEVSTAREQRWLGLQNGLLLRAAVGAGFVVLVTADRSVEFQQNLQGAIFLAELQAIAQRWEKQEGFLPAYKAQKRLRIRALIRRQKARTA